MPRARRVLKLLPFVNRNLLSCFAREWRCSLIRLARAPLATHGKPERRHHSGQIAWHAAQWRPLLCLRRQYAGGPSTARCCLTQGPRSRGSLNCSFGPGVDTGVVEAIIARLLQVSHRAVPRRPRRRRQPPRSSLGVGTGASFGDARAARARARTVQSRRLTGRGRCDRPRPIRRRFSVRPFSLAAAVVAARTAARRRRALR